MTAFFLAAGAMLALALAFVLPTLMSKKNEKPNGTAYAQRNGLNLVVLQDQLHELGVDLQRGTIDLAAYHHARQELEHHVAENTNARHLPTQAEQAGPRRSWPVLVIALALPLAAAFLYALLGTPRALVAPPTVEAVEGNPAVGSSQITAMVNRLAARLKTNPNDEDGWRMLARSYDTMRRFDAAVDAYKHLIALEPNNADALTDYAVTLAMSMHQSLSGEPERLIDRALSIDPNHVQALALSGSVAYERGEYAKAIGPWKKILAMVPADADIAQSISASVSKAESLAATSSSTRNPMRGK